MNKVLILSLILSFGVSSVALYSAAAPRPAPSKKDTTTVKSSTDNWERVEMKVLKVFSAKEGENVYRSYLVQWKGQEVVVQDTFAKTNYKVDETIAVLVTTNPYPQGKESYGLLNFSVMPPLPRR